MTTLAPNLKKDPKIFFSYSRDDQPTARRVYRALQRRSKARIFTDELLTFGDEDGRNQFRSLLRETDLFMLLVSPSALRSDWVLFELGAAWGLRKKIVPVLTDPTATLRLPVQIDESRLVSVEQLETTDVLNTLLDEGSDATSVAA